MSNLEYCSICNGPVDYGVKTNRIGQHLRCVEEYNEIRMEFYSEEPSERVKNFFDILAENVQKNYEEQKKRDMGQY